MSVLFKHGTIVTMNPAYQAQTHDVVFTMVDGQIVCNHGQMPTIDQKQVQNGIDKSWRRVTKRVGLDVR